MDLKHEIAELILWEDPFFCMTLDELADYVGDDLHDNRERLVNNLNEFFFAEDDEYTLARFNEILLKIKNYKKGENK